MNYEHRKPLPGYKIGGINIDYFDTRGAVEAIS
jgi:aconitate hydratase